MQTRTEFITLSTSKPAEFVEITDKVEAAVKSCGLKNGLAVIASQHTTTALCINEKCPRLQKDMFDFFERLAPAKAGYHHNHETYDGRNNAHSHLLSLMLKTSEIVQVEDGQMQIGTWQSIFFIELDGPRPERKIKIMMMGDFSK